MESCNAFHCKAIWFLEHVVYAKNCRTSTRLTKDNKPSPHVPSTRL